MRIGILRETKTPPDRRVPLTPQQCAVLKSRFPDVELTVQPSEIRVFSDDEYRNAGIRVDENLGDCDLLLGVKEVKSSSLLPGKRYLFFSHTIKKQPYNRGMLQDVLAKKIQLIDYETLRDRDNQRIIGFGRWAGIVGCYNGFLALGLRDGLYNLKPAHQCRDRNELNLQLSKIQAPKELKIVITGSGRVASGVLEVLKTIGIREISPVNFLKYSAPEPVFTLLEVDDYYSRLDGQPFDRKAFFKSGTGHRCDFAPYLNSADLYLACHFWDSSSPKIVTREDLMNPNCRTRIIADISCDVAGPIASTIRASTIAEPLYGYDPSTGLECSFSQKGAIGVMAVDNLPCELPRDASESFGESLLEKVFPAILGEDPDHIIGKASITTLEGSLGGEYEYLKSYAEGH